MYRGVYTYIYRNIRRTAVYVCINCMEVPAAGMSREGISSRKTLKKRKKKN